MIYGFTAEEIELAIAAAVKERDLGVAIQLTKMLAVVAPDRAQAVSDIFHAVASTPPSSGEREGGGA